MFSNCRRHSSLSRRSTARCSNCRSSSTSGRRRDTATTSNSSARNFSTAAVPTRPLAPATTTLFCMSVSPLHCRGHTSTLRHVAPDGIALGVRHLYLEREDLALPDQADGLEDDCRRQIVEAADLVIRPPLSPVLWGVLQQLAHRRHHLRVSNHNSPCPSFGPLGISNYRTARHLELIASLRKIDVGVKAVSRCDLGIPGVANP